MSAIAVRVFGRFAIARDGTAVAGVGAGKVRELLCYLLLHHGRPHAREHLASLLWPETTTARSRKYLRQALWQLQTAVCQDGRDAAPSWLRVETEWIRLDVGPGLTVDALGFEAAVGAAATAASDGVLPADAAAALEAGVALQAAPLLDGWYQDWCLRERERLRDLLLDALDLLVTHHEAHQRYAVAQRWAARLLDADPASERAHQHRMRLYALGGHRSRALRQFDECTTALDQELGVAPSAATIALRDRIRAGQLAAPLGGAGGEGADLDQVLGRLHELQRELAAVQGRVGESIAAVEQSLRGGRRARPAAVAPLRAAVAG